MGSGSGDSTGNDGWSRYSEPFPVDCVAFSVGELGLVENKQGLLFFSGDVPVQDTRHLNAENIHREALRHEGQS